jgi:hypothetical protein
MEEFKAVHGADFAADNGFDPGIGDGKHFNEVTNIQIVGRSRGHSRFADFESGGGELDAAGGAYGNFLDVPVAGMFSALDGLLFGRGILGRIRNENLEHQSPATDERNGGIAHQGTPGCLTVVGRLIAKTTTAARQIERAGAGASHTESFWGVASTIAPKRM